jgi:hypothetical protein
MVRSLVVGAIFLCLAFACAGGNGGEDMMENAHPVAASRNVTVVEDTPTPIVLPAVDAEGEPLTFEVSSGPHRGTLDGSPPNLTYRPDPSYTGPDQITLTARDATGISAPATVYITVRKANEPPAATPQTVNTAQGTPALITLAGSDPEGDSLSFEVTAQPRHGVLSGTGPNVTYQPAPDYDGPDSFAFMAKDATLSSKPATISITVTPMRTLRADPVLNGYEPTGIFNQWIEPVAFTRSEAGRLVTYVGMVDGVTGEQKLGRFDHASRVFVSKVVNATFPPDDHSGVAVSETPQGRLIVACTGHIRDNLLRFDLFDSWDAVTTLSRSLQLPSPATYVQIQTLGARTYMWTRADGEASWYYMYSDDDGRTWSAPQIFLTAGGKPYLMTRKVQRGAASIIRFAFYGHPTASAVQWHHSIRTGYIQIEPSGEHVVVFKNGWKWPIGSETPLIDAWECFDTVYTPPEGRTIRLFDMSDTDEVAFLVTEFDNLPPYRNARNKLLIGVPLRHIYTFPSGPGEDLAYDTYYPGLAFPRHGLATAFDRGRFEVLAASNDGSENGVYDVALTVYDEGSQQTQTLDVMGSETTKLVRPTCAPGSSYCVIAELTYYKDFGNFRGGVRILDLTAAP